MEVGTWLRRLGLGGSTALAAGLDGVDLRPGVAGGLVGIDDTIGASAAQQGGVANEILAKRTARASETVR